MRELADFESSAVRRRARKYATFAKRRWMRLYAKGGSEMAEGLQIPCRKTIKSKI